MKFNSIILITFCLLQVLINCVTDGSIEQSLKDATVKTLKYARGYHQSPIKLNNVNLLFDLRFNYPPLTADNIQFKFDDYGLLHIKFVNLKATLTGAIKTRHRFIPVKREFTAKLNNFTWEQVFVVTKNELGNGKLDLKFKSTQESDINFNIFKLTLSNKVIIKASTLEQKTKSALKTVNYTPIKIELRKISQIILETLQSSLK